MTRSPCDFYICHDTIDHHVQQMNVDVVVVVVRGCLRCDDGGYDRSTAVRIRNLLTGRCGVYVQLKDPANEKMNTELAKQKQVISTE